MGRKRITIDWDEVDKMLEAGCTGTEIAAALGMHPETLYGRCEQDNNIGFSDYLAQKRASGARLLKMKQFEIAMSGDKTMLIWLGKQYLDQTEKQEIKTTDVRKNLPEWMREDEESETDESDE
jgi:hypothetical protein